MSVSIAAVTELGQTIERAWSALDYDGAAFPELCVQHLARARLGDAVDSAAIIDWALAGALPRQADPVAAFGQPPVTLFRGRRFYIDALFWLDGSTSIHDHIFSGAFQVLSGSSIETTFSFEQTRDVGGQLRFGRLAVRGASLLRQGDIRPIVAGPRFIHSLFNLPRPAVSIVVRTIADAEPGVQLLYLPPGIAFNSFHVDEALQRQVQLVELLRKTDDPSFDDRVGALINRSDLHTAFAVLGSCARLPDRARLGRLVERVRDPEGRGFFAEWLTDAERIRFLYSRRELVHDADLRFMLAVLLNAHRRVDALALVAAHTLDVAPERQIAGWIAQLSTVTARLQLASGPWQPNLLGLPAFTPRLQAVLAAELSNRPDVASEDEAAFVRALRALPALAPLFR